MKISAFIPPFAALAIALSLAGCFGGEDDAGTKPVNPQDTAKIKTIKPGFYVADYTPFDTTRRWESEFTLNADGSYRLYWILSNEAVGDFKGSWFQKDSALYFHTSGETYMNPNTGFFAPHAAIESDTNALRDVTDSSFSRKEWTMLRQKPYWVTYRKQSTRQVGNGAYELRQDIKIDSATNMVVKVRITLDAGFLYSYKEDTVELFQADAKWYQLGSILGTEDNRGRDWIDSTKAFGAWDSIPGSLLQRIRVSDTAMEIWYPGGFSSAPRWDVYRKLD